MGKANHFIQAKTLGKKNSRKSNPLPFYIHFSRKRYPFHIPSISDKWYPFQYLVQNFVSLLTAVNQCTVFLHRNQSQKQPVHRRCFIFLFVPTPLHWRSINPLGFTFQHLRYLKNRTFSRLFKAISFIYQPYWAL